ncbi:MAG: NADP-dependent isocitrate dehydrogenase [Candidatus Lindowbacteria bacterium]|nr:NADP-dependent isocitrate dehydrogenase [Candidatus Lindowbacteria bacterium]
MTDKTLKIVWTDIDEAPALATHSLLPILQSFTKGSGIEFETRNISLASRIIANFPENLSDEQKLPNELAYLGELVKQSDCNVIKLPNISASISQLKAAIKELHGHGYDIPDYPEDPQGDAQKELQKRFSKVLGSAVSPVLREGNSDRRAAVSVKTFAKMNPHRMMKDWPADSKSHVAHMTEGDFFGSEKSVVVDKACDVKIEFVDANGETTVLKEKTALIEGEVVDTSVINVRALRQFYKEQINDAKEKGLLLSLHLKATMMKISDPMIFGHAVSVFYEEVLEKHVYGLTKVGFNPDLAIGDLYTKIRNFQADKQEEIETDIQELYKTRPELAMVDSDKGITNLHATNDIIIDASMPVVIRDGGRMWGPDGELHDTKALIPDRCYATMYQATIEDCQKHGAFDPSTMGSVSNVGLMAQKAEEYGSHDKTFKAQGSGSIRVVDESGTVLLEQSVEENDIFRMCQAKDEPIRNWVKLAVTRARATGVPTIFWLDEKRSHDEQIIQKVITYLKDHDTEGLDIRIMKPEDAMNFSLERIRKGEDTVSVTGNVLRDYLTDLFPILELGTSAKMLSIVPLLNGGGLFETGAGGSAPKHVAQMLVENHLRWDSLGEFCALVSSFEHLGSTSDNEKANVFAETLDRAIGTFLENSKSPSRKVNELDNRGSHYYLALYWAQALADQDDDQQMKDRFTIMAKDLSDNETQITDELIAVQGVPVDLGGYYHTKPELVGAIMRPSSTLNSIVDAG